MIEGPLDRLPFHHDRKAEGGIRLGKLQQGRVVDKPFITVITVVLNDAKGLEKTISSVKSQNFPLVEHIIIDGGSSDNTLSVLKSHSAFLNYWVSEPDNGIYDAMNKGLMLASGDIIGILNAGDTYDTDALSIIARYAVTYIDTQFIFGTVIKGKLRSNFHPWKIHWSFNFYTCHSVGFFIRRQAQYQLGPYSLAYRCSADYDLFFRMLIKHKMKGIATKPSEVIGRFALGGYSDRLNYLDHLVEETRIRLDNGQSRWLVLSIFILRYLRNIRRI